MRSLDFFRYAFGTWATAAMLAGCGVLRQVQDDMQPPVAAPGAIPQRAATSISHGTSSSRHLYVADPGSGAIYRYALANGLPQTSPDEVFAKVPGVDYLGVDGAGHIYAAGSENSSGFVQKFSAAGTLLGKIALDISVGSFAVDNDGFMYVAPDIYGHQAFTYSPKSFKSSGHAKPIATLTAEGGSTGPSEFISIAADDKGRLYDAAYFGLNVFDHPRRTSSQSATIGVPKGGWGPRFSGALAFDESNRVYANIGYQDYCEGRGCRNYYWHLTDFDAISRGLGPGRKDRWIHAGECASDYSSYRINGFVSGMAVFGGYLDAACRGGNAGVWVYRADAFMRQHAVETLSGLTRPSDAKIGP
jgi:hypothetical protein